MGVMRSAFFVLMITLALVASMSAQKTKPADFYGEEPFRNRTAIPNAAISALQNDKNFTDCWNFVPFEATSVDLNRDGVKELLIKSSCGNSATSYSFWILARRGRTFKPVFFTATMAIYIGNKKVKGYPDISASGCTANTCFFQDFSFNGDEYILKREWTRPNDD